MDLTYAWYKDGSQTPIAGQTGSTLTLTDVSDSGSYQVTVTASGDGQTQTDTSNAVAVQIAPRPVVLSWSNSTFTYDKTEKTVTATISNLLPGDDCPLTYDGDRKATVAGNYQVAVTALSNSNYTLDGVTNTTLNWQIVQAAGTASVTMADWTYGETAKAPLPSSSTNGIDHVTYHYTGTTSGGDTYDSDDIPTAAGSYTVTATFASTQNYKETTATDDFTIAPRQVVLKWSDETEFSYDGNEHSVTATVENKVSEDGFTLTYTGHTGTDADSYTAEITSLGNSNYTLEGVANTTLEWKILPVLGTASVTMEDWTYGETAMAPVPASTTNGIDHVTCHYTGTTSGGDTYDSANIPTAAGTYTVTATFAATQNYKETTATDQFTIAKKNHHWNLDRAGSGV